MMIVDLTEIEGTSRRYELSISPDDLDLGNPNVRLTGDVRVACEVSKVAASVEVKGSVTATAEMDCMRCLEPVRQELPVEFSASYVTAENFAADKEREVAAEDLDTDVLDSDRLDLKDVVREQLLLNLPEQLFCSADCKGLCPKCGANRNLIDCKCDLNETDPRWAALRDLRS